jgi:hypothetical protein
VCQLLLSFQGFGWQTPAGSLADLQLATSSRCQLLTLLPPAAALTDAADA